MDKFTGETILVEGKHVVVVPIGFLTDQVVPLGSRVLFSKTSKSLFQFEVHYNSLCLSVCLCVESTF